MNSNPNDPLGGGLGGGAAGAGDPLSNIPVNPPANSGLIANPAAGAAGAA